MSHLWNNIPACATRDHGKHLQALLQRHENVRKSLREAIRRAQTEDECKKLWNLYYAEKFTFSRLLQKQFGMQSGVLTGQTIDELQLRSAL